ncbi:Dioxygenases related to 2-nitropropane dioxygenase [Alloalcanivorax xenomutans]|uniref:NAD(P)H-dependent flavin oxidoreductase n=1 Tax=Alloalcanivorax xenomutans TaxID=1094342 RepID=UPI0006D5C2ED|nr:nitronate monooxygenase [Alloalcanivorax xenomutans]CUR44895.1 Dioxygenases related to 2-nitropropane dioxygenase [Alloalcanivorax xenomutans]
MRNQATGLPPSLARRLRLPLIAAPMFRVSGPELVIAACRQGVIGSFPTANCRTVEEYDRWLSEISAALTAEDAPFCPNLIMRRRSLKEELACLLKHKVEMVITSVGAPEPVIAPLHDIGCLVFADVANVRHAEKAIAAGADGLILLTAGAGGQTGWANGFAFARAVRALFDGPMVLAGGISDGQALWAAQALGCDLGYMGTKFIATRESLAADGYKQMLVDSRLDDIMLSRAFTGLETNTLRPSVIAAGLDPDNLPTDMTEERAATLYGGGSGSPGPKRWVDVWSAGHSVSGVSGVPSVAALVARTAAEYEQARAQTEAMLQAPF